LSPRDTDREASATSPAASAAGPLFVTALIALTFTMNAAGRGVTETFAVFLLPVEKALGASRSEIAATYSIYMVVHGLAAPFAGQLVDRFGARLTYATGIILLAAANVLASTAETVTQYAAFLGILSGFGAACLGMVVATSLLSRWFTNGLGFMMAMPSAAVGGGMLIFPLATQLLLAHYDWRQTHVILGVAVFLLLVLVLVLPVGRMSRGSPDWQRLRQENLQRGGAGWTATRAIRTKAFWALFALYFFTSVAAYAVLPHSVAFLVEKGFDEVWAAGAYGMTGALSVVGILAIGWFSDRAGRLTAVTLSKFVTLTGILCLLAVNWYPSWILVYAFVLCFGLMQGARGPVIAVLVSILFRGGSVGTIFGALAIALGLGAAAGSWISGELHDRTGTYIASFAFAAVASFAGLATYWISASLRAEKPALARQPHR
jgi:MFS family permease